MHRSTIAFLCAAILTGPLQAGEVRVINADAAFPEGPFWANGKLYYAEYGGNRVSVWDGAAHRTVWSQDGCGPSAVMPFAGGWLVTCYDNGTYVKIGGEGQVEQVWDKDATGAPLVGPNDLTSDGKGGAYLTASGPWESGRSSARSTT
jgi:gluconolactonase